ncbi:hypothetical protein ACN28G_00210 [Micromonospora sp. WMMA1923]|uniref:hypothetical protein n=1 Tax=Micromonospora sp. WMMA1923 TaxID=3404125 RepID=UPI003B92C831
MSMSDIPTSPTSHLLAADAAFVALTTGPAPLCLDCDTLPDDTNAGPDRPSGLVALPVLRHWLLTHPTAYTTRDAVWRDVVLRARLHGKEWTIAAVGMAMPALVRLARHLSTGYRGDPADIDNEILTGFLEALRDHTDLTRPAVYASLTKAAWRAGRQLRLADDQAVPVEELDHVTAGPRTPRTPYGHPDLLVRRAGSLGIIADTDVEPWIDVRLGRRSPEPIAARLGITVDALRMRLTRADALLADAITHGHLSWAATPDMHNTKTAKRRAGIRAAKAATRAASPRYSVATAA